MMREREDEKEQRVRVREERERPREWDKLKREVAIVMICSQGKSDGRGDAGRCEGST